MPKIYATSDDGRRFLYRIQCEVCDAEIAPGPDVGESGWQKVVIGQEGNWNTLYYCPEHRVKGEVLP